MSSKATNKGVAWLYNEVCALLDIWADQEVQQQLTGRLHNMCIYEKISKRLADLSIHRTGEQCREKIKKLRRDYRTIVDNNYSPAFARKMLGCYDKVHEIFGKCTVVKPSFVIESIVYNENIAQSKKGFELNFQTIEDYSVSELEQPKHTTNEQKIKKNSFEITQVDGNEEKKVMTGSSDSIGEQKMKTNSEILNSDLQQDQMHFRKVFKKMKIKHLEQKTDWNTFKRKTERRLKRQKILHKKLLKRQAALHNRYIELERKKFIHEMEQEQQRLRILEFERQKHILQEMNLFKSLLQMMAEKQGVKLSFQNDIE